MAAYIKIKKPSPELVILIEQASQHLVDFAIVWLKIKEIGMKEGFSEIELQDMLRPHLRKIGKTKDQIYYLFHRIDQIARVENGRKFTKEQINQKITQLEQEISMLKAQLAATKEESIALTPERRNELIRVDERIRNREQDIQEHQKQFEQVIEPRFVERLNKMVECYEAQYEILKRPVNTIAKDIIQYIKYRNLHLPYGWIERLPAKYKNASNIDLFKMSF